MEAGLLEKTGKSLTDWIAIVKKEDLEKHGQMVSFLKSAHGMTHGYANFVVHKARESDAGSHDGNELVEAQYLGKESLRPIYDELMKHMPAFGEDVEVAPKKSSVSLRRKRQFCLIQPSTKTRVDLGLKFTNRPIEGRLEASGPFGAMCTHSVQLTEIDQVDDELIQLIREAYNEAG